MLRIYSDNNMLDLSSCIMLILSLVRLSVRPSVRPSVCPSVCLSVCHTFDFLITFFTIRDRAFIFGICVPYDKTFLLVPWLFDHVTSTATFDLHLENFNSAHSFLIIRHMAFIFGMCVPYDKTFLMAP